MREELLCGFLLSNFLHSLFIYFEQLLLRVGLLVTHRPLLRRKYPTVLSLEKLLTVLWLNRYHGLRQHRLMKDGHIVPRFTKNPSITFPTAFFFPFVFLVMPLLRKIYTVRCRVIPVSPSVLATLFRVCGISVEWSSSVIIPVTFGFCLTAPPRIVSAFDICRHALLLFGQIRWV